jgi:hypothetical protein
MKIKFKIYVPFLLLFSVYSTGCATKPITTTTIGVIDGRDKVLIATQKSEFKEAVVSKVIEDLEKNDLYIEISDLSELAKKSAKEYEAIVIINSYKYFNFNKHVRNFLENTDKLEQKKVVLLSTAGTPKWADKGEELDAMSTASKIDEVDNVSMNIVQRVNSILSE